MKRSLLFFSTLCLLGSADPIGAQFVVFSEGNGIVRSEISGENDLLGVTAAECAIRSEGLFVPGVDVLPTEFTFQMFSKRRLYKPVFAVDASDCHYDRGIRYINNSVMLVSIACMAPS